MTDINNMRQNHPELVVRDVVEYIAETLGGFQEFRCLSREEVAKDMREILKNRGVNKWLHVRRLLIELKSRWRDALNDIQWSKKLARATATLAYSMKNYKALNKAVQRLYWLKGYEAAMQDMRQQVRALCHSPRDIDFPADPRQFGPGLPEDFPIRPHKRFLWRNKHES